jgi:hypothetical protein
MAVWGADYRDLVVPAHIDFKPRGQGEFQFGTVHGWIDYRLTSRDGREAVEFSWEGQSDTDHGCGRGWAVLDAASLEGRLFIHGGDDSSFVARRCPEPGHESRVRVDRDA